MQLENLQIGSIPIPMNAVGPEAADQGDKKSQAVDPASDKEAWNAQLFRSITSTSAAGLPVDHNKAANMGLSAGALFTSQQTA